jgi:protein-tyrosine phosphatase
MFLNKIKRPNQTQVRCEYLMIQTGCTLTEALNALTIAKDNLKDAQEFISYSQRRRKQNGKEKIGT